MTIPGNLLLPLIATVALAQQGQTTAVKVPARASVANADGSAAQSDYQLGPGDQIVVRVLDAEVFNEKPSQVDMSGFIRLPEVGRIHVGGLTVTQVEADVAGRLKGLLLHPDVQVFIAEFHSQPVSVIGSVKNPGVHQLQGRKSLIEILSLAGGLDPEAGPSVRITRRLENGRIPLKNAADDSTGNFSIAEVSLKSILEGQNPEENIRVQPYDVIAVPHAAIVYVMGNVQKAGGYVLTDRDTVSVLQAVSMAGGLDRMAKSQNSMILRRTPEGVSRAEIPVDLRKILEGKTPDMKMQPDDILYVPDNIPRRAFLRGLEAAIQTGTGVAIFRRPY
jgi:polysaccharide export outer membrane protein